SLAAEPPPHRTEEAHIVHDAVPAEAVEVLLEVVPVLGNKQGVACTISYEARDLRVEVDVAVPADHRRRTDSPAVQPEPEPVLHDRAHARPELRGAPVESWHLLVAEPTGVRVRRRSVEEEERTLRRVRRGLRLQKPLVLEA